MFSSIHLEECCRVFVRKRRFVYIVALAFGAASLVANTACGAAFRPVQAAALISPAEPSLVAENNLSGNIELVRDPSIIRQGSTYYVFSTDDGAPQQDFIKIRCSTDLKSWSECGHVFNSMPSWIRQHIPGVPGLWAPDISYFNHEYHLYYAASIFGTNHSLIGLATNTTLDATDPNYAWIDRGEVLASPPGADFNAIDPNILVDTDGSVWLTYGSFWSGIKQAPINPGTGMIAGSDPEPISLAARPTDHPHAVEGAFLVHHGSYYYLYVSFGLCCTVDPLQSNYRIMVGRGTSAHGPFEDMNGIPMLQGGGTQLLGGSFNNWNAAGGQSLFIDPSTDQTTIVFHAHHLPEGTPYLFVNSVAWTNDWPQIAP